MTEQVTLYPLHDEDAPSAFVGEYRYLVHKHGEDRVTIVKGFWRTGDAVSIVGLDSMGRLIDALNTVKATVTGENAS